MGVLQIERMLPYGANHAIDKMEYLTKCHDGDEKAKEVQSCTQFGICLRKLCIS
jgi:hypothetical protein